MALTEKQTLFCEEYLKDYNGCRSYKAAGYSEIGAKEGAYLLLKQPVIEAYICAATEKRGKRLQMTADDVFNEIKSIAMDDISNYLDFDKREVLRTDKEGKEYIEDIVNVSIKDSRNINTKNIKSVTRGKDGSFKFELYSRENALEKLGRIHAMFLDRVKDESDIPDLGALSPDELNAYLELVKKMGKK